MSGSIATIPLLNLAIAFIPVVVVIVIIGKWQLGYKGAAYAVARMLIQLLLIGYFLTYIFKTENSLIVVAVLAVMLFSASWIARIDVSGSSWPHTVVSAQLSDTTWRNDICEFDEQHQSGGRTRYRRTEP